MSLIGNEPKWMDCEAEGENTKFKYFGRFSLKPFLTHAEKSDAVRLAEKYCRGIENAQQQRLFLTTLAFLKFHVVEFEADWWKEDGLDLYDEEPVYVLAEILAEVQGNKPKAEPDAKVAADG